VLIVVEVKDIQQTAKKEILFGVGNPKRIKRNSCGLKGHCLLRYKLFLEKKKGFSKQGYS